MWEKIVAFIMSVLAFLGVSVGENKPVVRVSVYSVISECRYLQGACTDGKYIYQAFSHQVNSEKTGNYIFKISAKTFRVVDRVPLTAGHMNDMTYNPRTKRIVSANSGGTGSKAYMVTLIDPETLAVVDTKNVGRNIYSIEYDPANDIYYAGCYDSEVLVLDSDFRVTGSFPVSFDDYTKQCVCLCDGKLNFLLYGKKVSKSDIIRTYSTSGELLGDYELSIEGEPEGLFRLGGKFYATYAIKDYTRGAIYRLNEFA